MNQQQTSSSYSKLAAFGILIVLIFLAWQLLFLPYFKLWQDRTSENDFLQQRLSRLQFLIDDGDRINEQFRHLTQDSNLNALFLSEKSGALADAKFQRIIRQLISQSGAQVVQILLENKPRQKIDGTPSETEGLDSVTVRVVMRGDIKSIYTTLHKMENSRPLILLGNLEIAHNQTRYQIARTTQNTLYRASYDATAFIL